MAISVSLALVALPGLAGSRVPSAVEPVPAGAFQPLSISASGPGSTTSIAGLDPAHLSANVVHDGTTFVERAEAPNGPTPKRARPTQPESSSASVRKPPRYSITGQATFYHAGHTAMRLPRGTTIIVCGAGGCLERVVDDYGPQQPSRIIDLYVEDFFAICGCPSWSGVVDVTVHVY